MPQHQYLTDHVYMPGDSSAYAGVVGGICVVMLGLLSLLLCAKKSALKQQTSLVPGSQRVLSASDRSLDKVSTRGEETSKGSPRVGGSTGKTPSILVAPELEREQPGRGSSSPQSTRDDTSASVLRSPEAPRRESKSEVSPSMLDSPSQRRPSKPGVRASSPVAMTPPVCTVTEPTGEGSSATPIASHDYESVSAEVIEQRRAERRRSSAVSKSSCGRTSVGLSHTGSLEEGLDHDNSTYESVNEVNLSFSQLSLSAPAGSESVDSPMSIPGPQLSDRRASSGSISPAGDVQKRKLPTPNTVYATPQKSRSLNADADLANGSSPEQSLNMSDRAGSLDDLLEASGGDGVYAVPCTATKSSAASSLYSGVKVIAARCYSIPRSLVGSSTSSNSYSTEDVAPAVPKKTMRSMRLEKTNSGDSPSPPPLPPSPTPTPESSDSTPVVDDTYTAPCLDHQQSSGAPAGDVEDDMYAKPSLLVDPQPEVPSADEQYCQPSLLVDPQSEVPSADSQYAQPRSLVELPTEVLSPVAKQQEDPSYASPAELRRELTEQDAA